MLAVFESFERRLLFSVYDFPADVTESNPPTPTEIGQTNIVDIGTA